MPPPRRRATDGIGLGSPVRISGPRKGTGPLSTRPATTNGANGRPPAASHNPVKRFEREAELAVAGCWRTQAYGLTAADKYVAYDKDDQRGLRAAATLRPSSGPRPASS